MFYTAYERVSECAYDRLQDSLGQDERKHPPNVVVPKFCHRSSWCEQPPLHAGECDPLELIEVPYSQFINANPKKKATTKMKAETPPNSMFFKFEKVGDFARGLFVRYMDCGDKWGDGKPVGELTLRTSEGPIVVTCKGRLKNTIEHNLPKLKGMVVTVTFVSTTPSKHPQPFKNFEVEYDTLEAIKAQPARPQHRTIQAPTIAPEENDAAEPSDADLPF